MPTAKYIPTFNHLKNQMLSKHQIHLKRTSLGCCTVCTSIRIGRLNKWDSSSSVYPLRKQIFIGLCTWLIRPAMIIRLCFRLIITSLTNSPCHVPLINFLIKTSSTVVCDAFFASPSRLPEANTAKVTQQLPTNHRSNNKLLQLYCHLSSIIIHVYHIAIIQQLQLLILSFTPTDLTQLSDTLLRNAIQKPNCLKV